MSVCIMFSERILLLALRASKYRIVDNMKTSSEKTPFCHTLNALATDQSGIHLPCELLPYTCI